MPHYDKWASNAVGKWFYIRKLMFYFKKTPYFFNLTSLKENTSFNPEEPSIKVLLQYGN